MYIPDHSRFTELPAENQQNQQGFQKPGPLIKTPPGPRSKPATATSGELDQSSQQSPYDKAYAKMVQQNRATHNGQLKVDLANSGQALEDFKKKSNTNKELKAELDNHAKNLKRVNKKLYPGQGR